MAKKQAQRSSIDNRAAKLIEQPTPEPPLPYSPALMELVAEHDRQAWGKLEELRRTLYRDALPWYGEALANAWVARLRVSQSRDEKAIKVAAEKLRELEMRADREWSELLSVKPIVSFDTLAVVRATAKSAGFSATDAGMVAWNLAAVQKRRKQPPAGIPPEYRSKPIAKKQAAKLLGQANEDSGVKWLNACIADGTITCEPVSRQRFVFDLRQFPESVHGQLRDTLYQPR